jgi:hypothetical protein
VASSILRVGTGHETIQSEQKGVEQQCQ